MDLDHIKKVLKEELPKGLSELPPKERSLRTEGIPHAPNRHLNLTKEEQLLAVKNALRYFPVDWHPTLAMEFWKELKEYGHIYMYRFMPREYEIRAFPVDCYPAKTEKAKSMMVMIMNNLDNSRIAQYGEELITYGGNGSVLSNWAQYRLLMKYLCEIEEDQTLIMSSGHPVGLFPSDKASPMCIITNGLTIPNYSTLEDYNRMYALGTTIYGQMTAGSWCYIGSQGIVHGTTLTLQNAGRKYLGKENLAGVVFVTSGLGGMSGAQPKAGNICGCVTVVAEVKRPALQRRKDQGWLDEIEDDVELVITRIKKAKKAKVAVSIGYHGNIVDLWERLAEESEQIVELGSDQTSSHLPFSGGYYPVGLSVEEADKMMSEDPEKFKVYVNKSYIRQINAIEKLVDTGMNFWDYGNSFLLRCGQAGVDLKNSDSTKNWDFKYPSYVEEFMGDIFSAGFGPFRWICTSHDHQDLLKTDKIAAKVIRELMKDCKDEFVLSQYKDNLKWIECAESNKLVVGTEARILYSDSEGRIRIAQAFNEAIKNKELSGPVVISRDHHDVSGTDSPFRETSNIKDGSNKTADMSVQTVIGNAMRGATWVALHNGGGCGFGFVSNCGFGLTLLGDDDSYKACSQMLYWDVNNGIARRQWGGNSIAKSTIERQMKLDPKLKITMRNDASDELLEKICQ